MEPRIEFFYVTPDDLGVSSNDLNQHGLDRCGVIMNRFMNLLRLIYGHSAVRRTGFDENYTCRITCDSAWSSSYKLYRDLMAYAEYYHDLQSGDYPILANLLRRLARQYMTPQMLLEEERGLAA